MDCYVSWAEESPYMASEALNRQAQNLNKLLEKYQGYQKMSC